MEYELLFFTSVANEERIGEIKREIQDIITDRSGNISADFSDIGKRKFAYPIKKQTHGFFSFCHFKLEEKENLNEINRRLSLNEKIMRHLIVRADEVGKPIASQIVREPIRQEREPVRGKVEKKAEKALPKEATKVEMAELDEKLNEILDESPK